MAFFLSKFFNKIDKKGRVSVPSSFRSSILNETNIENFEGIIAYSSFINPCIEVCSFNKIEEISKKISSLDDYSDEKDALASVILGGSVRLPFDDTGRVLLPKNLLEEAEITEGERAVFFGKGEIFEIWAEDKFIQYEARQKELAKQYKSALSKIRK